MKSYFIIQGHTKFFNEIIDCFNSTPNVIWCTDEDSPKNHLEAISNSNIQLVTIPKRQRVLHNINIHIESSLTGIKVAKRCGADMVIKLRSDMTISNTEQFIKNIIKDGKIYGNNYVNHNTIVKPPLSMIYNTKNWLYKNCNNIQNLSNYNYITDWIYYSDVDTLIYFYENCIRTDYNLDMIEEHRFIGSYLMALNKPIDFSLEYLKQYFGIFMNTMKKTNVDIYSLKEKLNYSKLDDVIPNVYIGV